jgi:hypothetical protein
MVRDPVYESSSYSNRQNNISIAVRHNNKVYTKIEEIRGFQFLIKAKEGKALSFIQGINQRYPEILTD